MRESTVNRPMLTARFRRALDLAMDVHGLQVRRQTTIPYLAHLMSVCSLVLESGGDEDAAIGGLLHDAVEDSDDGAVMLDRIRDDHGDRVAGIVLACSDTVATPGQDKPEWRPRKERYIARMRTETDDTTLLVSACDKLHNARSIVADLGEIGDAVWSRFHAPRTDQLWYYRSLAEIHATRLRNAVTRELLRTVARMEGGGRRDWSP